MTLYYTLVFVLLMAEMAMFMVLILPLPYTVKRKLFTFIAENPVVAKIEYWMKITFIFILILFIDSVNRVYRVQVELALATDSSKNGSPAAVMGHERLEVQARKFYSQRNMYLCGFTLFLSLILNRTYVMILEVMQLEDRLRAHEGAGGKAKTGGKAIKADGAAGAGQLESENAKLREQLASREADLQAMRKQSEGLAREYDDLADKYEEKMPVEARKTK